MFYKLKDYSDKLLLSKLSFKNTLKKKKIYMIKLWEIYLNPFATTDNELNEEFYCYTNSSAMENPVLILQQSESAALKYVIYHICLR